LTTPFLWSRTIQAKLLVKGFRSRGTEAMATIIDLARRPAFDMKYAKGYPMIAEMSVHSSASLTDLRKVARYIGSLTIAQ
jgi:hypothetical protein